mmetsp:Transcript_30271/g.72029  ORF Transcript_30271/g.72029 Transcript_30271/m.72029 type:complete len:566 (-) Transcript_30271:2711-4408(-)
MERRGGALAPADSPQLITSTPTGTVARPTASENDDIARLEEEVKQFSEAMATMRKYSRDWFFFDRKLKAASDELGAAREDRDLFPSDIESDLPRGIPATVLVHDVGDVCASTTKDGSQLKYSEDDKRKEYKRIEDEIARLPKFSGIWFSLKEELVALRVSLDEQETIPFFETEAGEPAVTKRIMETPRRDRRHCNDGRKHQQQQQRNPPNSPFKGVGVRQISPPPSPPVSPLNPSPYCSKSRGRNRLYSFDSSASHVDPNTVAKIQKLKLDHERLSNMLNALPDNSKEWRDIKWKTINLEEQLDDIENSSNSTCDRSGWTSWSDEDEILSHTDSTELSLVLEALAMQNGTSQSARQAEQCVSATKIQSIMRQRRCRQTFHKVLRGIIIIQSLHRRRACSVKFELIVKSTTTIQSIYRQRYLRKLDSVLLLQSIFRKTREKARIEKRVTQRAATSTRAKQTKQFDSLPNESPLLLSDDEKAKEQYHAIEACGDVDTKPLDFKSAHRQFERNVHLRSLSQECMRLSHRMRSLPPFSPEWTLSKVEMGFVTEEMEFLYEESLRSGQLP